MCIMSVKKKKMNTTNLTLGHLSSQGISAITSTASAPPTPTHTPPRPPRENKFKLLC